MLIVLLSLALQTDPSVDADGRTACAAVRWALNARINRAARVEFEHSSAVRTLTAIEAHERIHGPWPAGANGPVDEEAPRGSDARDVEAMKDELYACLRAYPIDRDRD